MQRNEYILPFHTPDISNVPFFLQSYDLEDESRWNLGLCERPEAIMKLEDKADGTFLIRLSPHGGYALSIA